MKNTLPEVGKKAPVFTLFNQAGEKVSLKNFKGKKNIVLYFYPKAMTPGCTTQAVCLTQSKKKWSQLDTVVFGVSPDNLTRLNKFIEKEKINFDLLSDEDLSVSKLYGAYGPKKLYGREYMGVYRMTFIIGMDGKIMHIMEKVNTKTHHEVVMELIRKG